MHTNILFYFNSLNIMIETLFTVWQCFKEGNIAIFKMWKAHYTLHL